MPLTDEQRIRIEENRKKALLKREEKLKARTIVHPYPKYDAFMLCKINNNKKKNLIFNTLSVLRSRPVLPSNGVKEKVVTVAGQPYVDTEAGFLLDEDDVVDKNKTVL